jgi:hypothetical protein
LGWGASVSESVVTKEEPVKVRLKFQITGTRNGVRWPAPGEVVDLPDVEGAKLCASGLATPVVEDKVEKPAKRASKRTEKR